MSDTTASPYMDATEQLILRAAAEILRRTGSDLPERVFSAEATTAEILNIGGLRATMTEASDTIHRALIALQVNAEHYPAPEPQSLRVAP